MKKIGIIGSEGRMGEAYLAFWAQLKDVSLAFRAALLEEGLAYSGLMARTLVEQPALLENWVKAQSGPVAFVGLGAMTRAELTFFQRLIAGNHVIPYWDLDRTLLKRMPEISTAFQPLLTTLGSKPLHFWSDVAESPPRVQVSGVPNAALVAQVAARWVHNNLEKGIRPEDQALVLADERYLVPVLAALPEALPVAMS